MVLLVDLDRVLEDGGHKLLVLEVSFSVFVEEFEVELNVVYDVYEGEFLLFVDVLVLVGNVAFDDLDVGS